jgi:hypothetical protein
MGISCKINSLEVNQMKEIYLNKILNRIKIKNYIKWLY